MTRTIAVLRPEPGNSATTARVRAAGWQVIALPLFAVHALDWTAPDPRDFDGVLFTSANAARHGGPALERVKGLPAFAVGENTAKVVRAAGFDVMASGVGDAATILALAEEQGYRRLLHLGGRERSIDVGGAVHEAIAVYASEPVPVTAAKLTALAGSVALLHSPRAARQLATLVDAAGIARDALALVAISPAVALAAGAGWRALATAAAPSDEAMIAAALTLVD